MTTFFIDNRVGVGYVVMYCSNEGDGWLSSGSVLNFGDRQSDAIEFRNDCNRGVIDWGRIKALSEKYTDRNAYRYLGAGRVRKTESHEQTY